MAAGLISLGLAGCGTRLSDNAFAGAANPSSVSAGGQPGGTASGSGTGPGLSGTSGSGSGGGSSLSGGATSAGAGPGTGGATGTGPASSGGTGGGTTGSGGSGGGAANGASDVGVTANSITIGNVTAINGALGPYAFGVTLPGLQAWVNATNARGGINGRKIILDTCDDSADGQQNLSCATKLVSQKHVFAMLANNTDACASSAKYEYQQGVPDVGFPLCNGYYMYPNMFSIYGSGYPRNGKLPPTNENQAQVYKWAHDNKHVSKGAFFFYIIPVSQQAGYFEEVGAKSAGIATTYEGGGNHEGENPADPTFDTDVINMRADHVDVIFDAMDTAGNAKLCAAMDRQGFTVPVKMSTVEVFGQAVGQWSSPCRDSVYSADASEPYSDTSNPVVAQFRKDFSTYEPHAQLHQWALDGYGLGVLFGDAIKSMGSSPTRAGLLKWMNSWKQPAVGGPGYTFDGLADPVAWTPLNYSQPAPACDAIGQWNNAAGTFVTDAKIGTCYNLPWYGTPFSPDGS
ncbi:MAG TPA: ABC transporter substrate-binding protein [Acidimicrobiales bacterium]|nr:ABC transporter substrate-binding protein [Acidimicrobiales bacterium]